MLSKGSESVLLVCWIGLAHASCASSNFRHDTYHPRIDVADFRSPGENLFFPLVPGTTLKYVEKERGAVTENEVTVTHDIRTVMGVSCVVVHDVARIKGRVAEDTFDWLARDREGTVWYFGEATREISPGGLVSTLGSWEAGVGGGEPGILMPGHTTPGDPYRQEYLYGVAEDMGQIVATGETVVVPAGTFTGCVKTREWSLLESGHEFKWYAPGVGVVKETSSGGAVVELVAIEHE